MCASPTTSARGGRGRPRLGSCGAIRGSRLDLARRRASRARVLARRQPVRGRAPRGSTSGSTTARACAPRRRVTFAGAVPTHGLTVTIATPDGHKASLTHLGPLLVRRGDAVAGRIAVAEGISPGEELLHRSTTSRTCTWAFGRGRRVRRPCDAPSRPRAPPDLRLPLPLRRRCRRRHLATPSPEPAPPAAQVPATRRRPTPLLRLRRAARPRAAVAAPTRPVADERRAEPSKLPRRARRAPRRPESERIVSTATRQRGGDTAPDCRRGGLALDPPSSRRRLPRASRRVAPGSRPSGTRQRPGRVVAHSEARVPRWRGSAAASEERDDRAPTSRRRGASASWPGCSAGRTSFAAGSFAGGGAAATPIIRGRERDGDAQEDPRCGGVAVCERTTPSATWRGSAFRPTRSPATTGCAGTTCSW